jgi:hypothetical protein
MPLSMPGVSLNDVSNRLLMLPSVPYSRAGRVDGTALVTRRLAAGREHGGNRREGDECARRYGHTFQALART